MEINIEGLILFSFTAFLLFQVKKSTTKVSKTLIRSKMALDEE